MGQSSAPAPANPNAKAPTYEVVSIRPDKSSNLGGEVQSMRDGFRWTNMPISPLIHDAYGVPMNNQIVGLPAWVNSDPYDIEAKVGADTAEAWKKLTIKERRKQQNLMLQSLLVDRCQLKFHRETREMPVYDLVIARGGLKMKEAAADEINAGESMSSSNMTANAQSTESIVAAFSGEVGRLIVDKTGLEGKKFDFEVKWTPENVRAAADTEAGPSIFTALEEELGLKLVPSKEPLDVLVIDHIERPSPN
ncbi:MAG: TIGR03435 family protein [Terracidiphilus sp.]